MSVYVATFGRDPAPVALGLDWALGLSRRMSSPITKILLISESSRVQNSRRTNKLKEFLKDMTPKLDAGRVPVDSLLCESPGGKLSPRFSDWSKDIAAKLEGLGDTPIYINLTGGSKMLSLAALEAARAEKNAYVFVANGYDPGGLSATLVQTPLAQERTIPSAKGLSKEDYVKLYRHDLDSEKVDEKFGAAVKVAGRYYKTYEHQGRLFVISTVAVPHVKPTPMMQQHRQHTEQLGGTLAVPLFQAMSEQDYRKEKERERSNATENQIRQGYQNYLRTKQKRAQRLGGSLIRGDCRDEQVLNTAIQDALKSWTESSQSDQLKKQDVAAPSGQRTLISLVGDQPIPTLVSFFAHKLDQVYLVTSPQKIVTAKRLKVFLEGLEGKVKVQILPDAGPGSAESTKSIVASIVEKCGNKEMFLNLNGGTTLMAIGAYQAKGQAVAEYVNLDRIFQLMDHGANGEKVRLDLNVDAFLRVHGFRLKASPHSNMELDEKLYKLAIDYLRERDNINLKNSNVDEVGKESKNFRRFREKFEQLCPTSEFDEGRPGEYAAYYEIKQVLNGGEVLFEPKVIYQDWDYEQDCDVDEIERAENDFVKSEPDVLALYNAELLTVDAKPSIERALSENHLEDSSQMIISQAFGGHYARGMILAHKPKNVKQVGDAFQYAVQQKDQLTLATRFDKCRDVMIFPPSNPENPEALFREWGWLDDG